MPAVSATPVLFKAITLEESSMLLVGVSVAVQVTPPSDDETAERLPLAIVRSLLVKPVTASLKVIVTSDVSPMINELSATTIDDVGRTVSVGAVACPKTT